MLVTSVLILFYYLFFFVLFNVIFQIPISFILAHPIHPSNSLPVVRSLSVSLSFVSSQSLSCSYILYIYSRSYSLSLSLSRFSLLIYILLRVAGFPLFPLFFLRPPGTCCPLLRFAAKILRHCSGVSGALEGPSFQNHCPQRTHQTAYAKRESRRRTVGSRRNLGQADLSRIFHFYI